MRRTQQLAACLQSEAGGFREAVLEVTGERVYSKLKWESGVHRVQRVPATESQGRVHTSTATVAIMPEAEEVDVYIDPKDIELTTARSGGAGGRDAYPLPASQGARVFEAAGLVEESNSIQNAQSFARFSGMSTVCGMCSFQTCSKVLSWLTVLGNAVEKLLSES